MAIVNISISCGCGFHARTVEEAAKHADEQKHAMDIFGSVKSSVRKVRKASSFVPASPRPRRESSTTAPLQVEEEGRIDFNNLRAKLQKRQKES